MSDWNILTFVFLDICSSTSLYSALVLLVFIMYFVLFVQLCTYYILSWWEGHGKTVPGRFSASARWSHRDLVTREFLLRRVRGVGPESLHFCKLPADGPASSQGFRTNFVFVGRLCSAALFFFFMTLSQPEQLGHSPETSSTRKSLKTHLRGSGLLKQQG